MIRRLALLAILVGIFAIQVPMTAAVRDPCNKLQGYFAAVDQRLGEGFITVFQDVEWRSGFDASIAKANRSDMSILVLSPEEMEPITRLLSVAGDVLLSFPEDKIPPVAEALHSTALELWLIAPAMFRALASGGLLGALIFVEEVEELERTNLAAQALVERACPREVLKLGP